MASRHPVRAGRRSAGELDPDLGGARPRVGRRDGDDLRTLHLLDLAGRVEANPGARRRGDFGDPAVGQEGHRAQLVGRMQLEQGPPRRGQVADLHRYRGHHAVPGRAHHRVVGGHARQADAGLCLPLARLGHLERGRRLVQRRLADEALLEQLPAARMGGARLGQRGLRLAQLGLVARQGQRGLAGIDLGQRLSGLHLVAGLHVQLDDAALRLGADRGLAHRLERAVPALGLGETIPAHRGDRHPGRLRRGLCGTARLGAANAGQTAGPDHPERGAQKQGERGSDRRPAARCGGDRVHCGRLSDRIVHLGFLAVPAGRPMSAPCGFCIPPIVCEPAAKSQDSALQQCSVPRSGIGPRHWGPVRAPIVRAA